MDSLNEERWFWDLAFMSIAAIQFHPVNLKEGLDFDCIVEISGLAADRLLDERRARYAHRDGDNS